MEDSQNNHKKPLRTASNKVKDLYNTYLKNEGVKNIPITEDEYDKTKKHDSNMEDESQFEKPLETDNMEVEIQELNEQNEEHRQIIVELTEKITAMENEKQELREQLIRKAAEMENILRRTQKEKSELIYNANERLLSKMIELLDDMNKAVEVGEQSTDYNALLSGLNMIRLKAQKMFEDAGVKLMDDPIGTDFNVDLQEALMRAPSDYPENYVVQVLQPGYMLNDKVLRYAKVVTSAGNNS